MNKLRLRTEHLGALTTDELRRIAGAVRDAGGEDTLTAGGLCWSKDVQFPVSDDTCGVSRGSCPCFCP